MSGGTFETEEEEFAFVQYLDCTELMDEVGNRLGCVCIRCSTADDVEYTISPELADNEVEERECLAKSYF